MRNFVQKTSLGNVLRTLVELHIIIEENGVKAGFLVINIQKSEKLDRLGRLVTLPNEQLWNEWHK